jgi:hypothetical protein
MQPSLLRPSNSNLNNFLVIIVEKIKSRLVPGMEQSMYSIIDIVRMVFNCTTQIAIIYIQEQP